MDSHLDHNHLAGALAGTDFTTAILLGFALFIILETAVVYLNFRPWFHRPSLMPSPSPERFLRAAIQSFLMMVLVAGILTTVYAELDYEQTTLIDWFGYNNICILFDYAPATYISPVFWFCVGYLMVRFAVEDTKRLMRMKELNSVIKASSYAINVLFVITAAVFSLVLAVSPEENLVLHAGPFVALILVFPLVYVMHCWQDNDRTRLFIWAAGSFMLISLVKASFTVYAIATGPGDTHVASYIAQPVDIIWVLFALGAPFLMPVPKMPDQTDT